MDTYLDVEGEMLEFFIMVFVSTWPEDHELSTGFQLALHHQLNQRLVPGLHMV